jgi:hypothetical protein
MPIGRHHPRSSSIPGVDTGPIVSIFGTLPGSSILSVSSTLGDSARISSVTSNRRPSASVSFLWKYEKVTGCQIRRVRWVKDDRHFVLRQKQLGEDGSVRLGVVMVKQPVLAEVRGDVFARSDAVATKVAEEPGIQSLACWDRCFALPQLLYRWHHQSRIFRIPPRTFPPPYCFMSWRGVTLPLYY